MKKNIILLFAILTGIFLLSCKGETGPAGAIGEDGKPLYVQMFQYNVYPSSSYQDVSDSHIYEGEPTRNYGKCPIIALTSASNSVTSRSVFKFANLDNFIPANVTIKQAYLVLYGFNWVTFTASTISAYKLTRNWTEGIGDCNGSATTDVSWNNYSGPSPWTNPGGDFATTPISDAVKVNTYVSYYTLKLNTSVVKDWIQSPSTNYGVIVKVTDETKMSFIYIASSEHSDITWRPKLVIYYTIP